MLPARHPGGNAAPLRAAGRRRWRAPLALVATWIAVVCVFWFGLFVASMRPGVSGADALDLYGYFLPKYVHGSDALRGGALPLWNPWEYAGLPLLGASQPAVLYPPRALAFALLPPTAALHAFMIFHYLVLGLGAFVMLRALGLGAVGATFGTVCLVFQPLMMQSHYHPLRLAGFTWVPWLVTALVRAVERPGFGAALGLGALAALQALSGYPEYALDTALALAVLWPFLALPRPARWGPSAATLGGAALLAGALAAPQLVALWEMVQGSARAARPVAFLSGLDFDPRSFGEGIAGWVGAISTFGYLPALGWVCVLVGLVAPGTRRRWAMLALWGFASLALSPWLRAVPPFNRFRTLVCWASIVYVPLAYLGGRGFERLAQMARRSARPGVPEIVVGTLALGAAVAVSGRRTLAGIAVCAALLVLARLLPRRGAGLAVGAAVAASLAAAWTWLPPHTPSGLWHRYAAGQVPYPSPGAALARAAELRAACGNGAAGRFLVPAETLAGVPVTARLAVVQGYPESLPPGRTTRLLDAVGLDPGTLLALDWTRLARAASVLRLLDVSCVVVADGDPQAMAALGLAPAGRLPDGRRAFARAAEGRVRLVPSARVVAGAEAALAAVLDPGFAPAGQVILEERPPAETPTVPEAPAGGHIRVREEAPGRLVADVEAPMGGWLVVAESHFPGWRARVDGRPAPVLRGDYALLAVRLAPGARRVELWYRPRGFTAAVVLAILGTAVLAAGGLRCVSRSNWSRSSPRSPSSPSSSI